MNSVLLPLPLRERVGERGLVDSVFIVALRATAPLTPAFTRAKFCPLSRKGRGDWLNRLQE